MRSEIIITAQVWEWYGNEEMTSGRYKPKGSHQFIFEGDDLLMYDESKVLEDFNKRFNSADNHIRYEAKEIDLHFRPTECTYENGEFKVVRW